MTTSALGERPRTTLGMRGTAATHTPFLLLTTRQSHFVSPGRVGPEVGFVTVSSCSAGGSFRTILPDSVPQAPRQLQVEPQIDDTSPTHVESHAVLQQNGS